MGWWISEIYLWSQLTIDYGDGMTVVYERSEYLNVENRAFDGYP